MGCESLQGVGESASQAQCAILEKKRTCRTPMALGSGAAPMVSTCPPPRAPRRPASAAPSAMHAPARCPLSPAAMLPLRLAREDTEDGVAVLREDLLEERASEPGAVGGWRALRPCLVDARSPRAASAVRLSTALPIKYRPPSSLKQRFRWRAIGAGGLPAGRRRRVCREKGLCISFSPVYTRHALGLQPCQCYACTN